MEALNADSPYRVPDESSDSEAIPPAAAPSGRMKAKSAPKRKAPSQKKPSAKKSKADNPRAAKSAVKSAKVDLSETLGSEDSDTIPYSGFPSSRAHLLEKPIHVCGNSECDSFSSHTDPYVPSFHRHSQLERDGFAIYHIMSNMMPAECALISRYLFSAMRQQLDYQEQKDKDWL